jgi:hypothetical protein
MSAWKPADEAKFAEAYMAGATNDQLLTMCGGDATQQKVFKYIRRMQQSGAYKRRFELDKMTMPVSPMRSFNDFWKLEGEDGFIIAGDAHAPFYSAKWCNRGINVARKFGIKKLLIAGDGLDMHSFSGWGADPKLNWEDESKAAAAWLWVLYHSFEKIYWLRGNHEDRISRKTDWQVSAIDPIRSLLLKHADEIGEPFLYDPGKIKVSGYPKCIVDNEWEVVHPKAYSKLPLRVANSIALKRNMNVIVAHSHHAAQGFSDDGRHVIIDSGGWFDEDLIEYVSKSETTHPNWQPGFVVYKNGCAQLMAREPFTDWSVYDA